MSYRNLILAIASLALIGGSFGCADDDASANNTNNTPIYDGGTMADMPSEDTGESDTGNPTDMGTGDASLEDMPNDAADMFEPDAPQDMTTDASDPDMFVPPVEDPNELLVDRHFARGLVALGTTPGMIVPLGNLTPGFEAGIPAWQLGQWGNETSLHSVAPVTLPSGAVRWSDTYGGVTIGPVGSPEADLSLRVNAYEEYGGVYRTANDPNTWPHLLAQQDISTPGALGPGCPPISELSALEFSMDARLLFHQQNVQAGYSAGRHAADYLVFFTVQNLNTNSTGYGDFLWFGLHPFADRPNLTEPYIAGDDFSGKLIYNVGNTILSDAPLDDGQWHTQALDILPHVITAIQTAGTRTKTDGSPYLASQNLADYRIGGMNIGWEIPGLNNAEIQIRNLSLIYERPVANGSASFQFNTNGDREGWTTANVTELNGGPLNGLWTMTVPGSDPALTSPTLNVDATTNKTVMVRMANAGNPAASSNMQVFWSTAASPGFAEAKSTIMAVSNGGGYITYTFDLTTHPQWNGVITQLRVDPIQAGDGNAIGIDFVSIAP